MVPPWPEEADGDGPTLELRHHDLDNGRPEHWIGFPLCRGEPRAGSTAPTTLADRETPRSLSPCPGRLPIPSPFNGGARSRPGEGGPGRAPRSTTPWGQLEEVLVNRVLPPGTEPLHMDLRAKSGWSLPPSHSSWTDGWKPCERSSTCASECVGKGPNVGLPPGGRLRAGPGTEHLHRLPPRPRSAASPTAAGMYSRSAHFRAWSA